MAVNIAFRILCELVDHGPVDGMEAQFLFNEELNPSNGSGSASGSPVEDHDDDHDHDREQHRALHEIAVVLGHAPARMTTASHVG